jgi:hypothetical protein
VKGKGVRGGFEDVSKDRGLMMPPYMPPPEPRGLGLNLLETHILQFDYQNQKLDAALSNLF